MGWREFSMRHLGPGILSGITLGGWMRLLRSNGLAVHPFYWPRALNVTGSAVMNSLSASMERWRYGSEVEKQTVGSPLFVLGHWRSGTTLLHDLLALDARFAFPNCYQVMMPATFLGSEALGAKLFRFFSPSKRPMDNMKLDPAAAWEDEFVMCGGAFTTPYLQWAFPSRLEYYERYLTFERVSREEIERWQRALMTFLKKLTLKYGKPAVLKSPTHTARVRLLLEMFPEAKFVHIRRDPHAVFRSAVHTHRKTFAVARLQRGRDIDWEEVVIRQYRKLHEAYFEQRGLIPAGHLHELSFEDLEARPVEEVRKLYGALNLADFAGVEATLRRYVDSIRGYQKNSFAALPPGTRERLSREWGRCFDEWAYDR